MKKIVWMLFTIVFLVGIIIYKYVPHTTKTQSKIPQIESNNNSNTLSSTTEQSSLEAIDPLSIRKRSIIDMYLKENNYNGNVLVVQNNKVIIQKSYGYNDLQNKIPNSINDLYPVGSITKYVTAIGILQLQEQGKLSTNDTLDMYFPYAPYANTISLRALLNHTSGISGVPETQATLTREEVIHKILQNNLLFSPGTNWNYSDANYAILGAILEKVSGESYDQYIQTHVFDKINAKDAHVLVNDPIPFALPHNYVYENNTYTEETLPSMTQVVGSGNLFTSLYALYQIDKALVNYQLISPESLTLMGKVAYQSYGLGIYHTPPVYANNGVFGGFITSNLFNQNMYIILFSNIKGTYKPGRMVYQIRQKLLHEDRLAKKQKTLEKTDTPPQVTDTHTTTGNTDQ